MAQVLQDHLRYILRSGDDMGAIDWGKSLESMEQTRVFRVTRNDTPILSGGNQSLLPRPGNDGDRFLFPDSILHEASFTGEDNAQYHFILELAPLLDPWKTASSCGLLTFLLGLCFLMLPSRYRPVPDPIPGSLPASTPSVPGREIHVPLPALSAGHLLIDPHFNIRGTGPAVAELLGLPGKDLLNGHLLDLYPDPSLLQAMETREKQKVIGAFPKAPALQVTLEPVNEGHLLLLEPMETSQNPKNP
ncbi:MAG TPA: PAS domain-containing protein [bacterium]|nr:PAS domain-containing protein [bacterium]